MQDVLSKMEMLNKALEIPPATEEDINDLVSKGYNKAKCYWDV